MRLSELFILVWKIWPRCNSLIKEAEGFSDATVGKVPSCRDLSLRETEPGPHSASWVLFIPYRDRKRGETGISPSSEEGSLKTPAREAWRRKNLSASGTNRALKPTVLFLKILRCYDGMSVSYIFG